MTAYETWLQRGSSLGCFRDETEAAAYALAWLEGADDRVRAELERILTRIHRMPHLNAISFPGLLDEIDALPDCPPAQPEDWRDSDFEVRLATGGRAGIRWLAPAGTISDQRWNELVRSELVAFLSLEASEKAAVARELERSVRATHRAVPAAFGRLVGAASAARMLVAALPSSEGLSSCLLDPPSMAPLVAPLVERCGDLAAAWFSVLGGTPGGPRPMTLVGLRGATGILGLKQFLIDSSSPGIENLTTYLRCTEIVGV
jgi:hypothetical protein